MTRCGFVLRAQMQPSQGPKGLRSSQRQGLSPNPDKSHARELKKRETRRKDQARSNKQTPAENRIGAAWPSQRMQTRLASACNPQYIGRQTTQRTHAGRSAPHQAKPSQQPGQAKPRAAIPRNVIGLWQPAEAHNRAHSRARYRAHNRGPASSAIGLPPSALGPAVGVMARVLPCVGDGRQRYCAGTAADRCAGGKQANKPPAVQ